MGACSVPAFIAIKERVLHAETCGNYNSFSCRDHEDTTFVNEILTTREDGMPTFQWNIQYPESLRRELLAQGMRLSGTKCKKTWANRILNGPEATNLFSGLMSTSDEQIIPGRFTLMEDEQRDEEDESEGDEDEEFFSALSCQTDVSDTLQEEALIVSPYICFHKLLYIMSYQRSQSNENSSIPGSPSSASQELDDDDALIDILIDGIAVAQGALRDLKHATLDEARWSRFVEDCDGVNNQVIARLTKELVPWYLPFASLYTMALYRDSETSDSHRTTNLNRLVDFGESAISAVERCSPAAPDIAAIHHNVGNGYYLRSHTTSGDDIDRAIEHSDLAIATGSRAPSGMAMFLTCSARALASRYEKSHNFEDLQSAIDQNEDALSLVSSDDPTLNNTRAICLINGGNLLIHRYDRALHRDIAYLEKAISYLQEALQLREQVDSDTSRPLQALGHAKLRYFFRTLSAPSLAGAVDCFEKATFVGEGHVSFPLIAHNLALGHAVSHFFSKKPDSNQGSADLAKAIMWIEKALEYRPFPHAHRSSSLLIYSWCLLEVLQTPSIFQESHLQKLESSLQELEKGDTTAVATALKHRACLATWRYNETRDPKYLVDSLQYSDAAMKTAQDFHHGQYPFSPLDICEVAGMRLQVLKLKNNDAAVKRQIDQAFESFEHASSLSASTCDIMDQLSIASVWVSQALEMKHHSVAVAYPVLLCILRGCINLNPAIEIRHAIAEILRPISPADVAAAIMGFSDPNLAQAVELLEYGRDIVLSHIRAMRQDDERIRNLESMDSDAVVRFEAVCKQLDRNIHGLFLSSGWKWTSAFVPSSDMQEREAMSAQLQSKDVPPIGSSPSYAELKQAANGGTVIIFNFSKYGCDALIIVEGEESPVRVSLGGEKEYQYFGKLASVLGSSLKLVDTVESDGKLQKVLKALWGKAVEPVTKELKALGVEIGSRLWLLPTGLARLFPLHAAGPYKRKGFDPSDLSSLYAISYISTLDTLLTAKASRTLDEPPSVFFIGDDGEDNPAVEELPYVKTERDTIAKEFGDRATCLFGEQATLDAVLVNLPTHPWVHFGCHGTFDPIRPFQSCFILNGGQRLTLPAIMRSRSPQGEFAFYSACNTASSPDQTSGEVVNLASAMEVCGFRSVVGTLYPIHDDFAANVCREFYKSARSRGWTDAAYSLKDCILELRRKMWEEAEELGIRKWIAYIHIGV
ncbi:CHAT domain-containing protein [Armillaria borealis]|uniref:CHAT domain-containing protein n=1 Tax=Armillaria borealis TaxID=47425 RepID=A0AA39MHA7_9AGAR|nr:CHAT domain-containing protein [Armillaria borealis]